MKLLFYIVLVAVFTQFGGALRSAQEYVRLLDEFEQYSHPSSEEDAAAGAEAPPAAMEENPSQLMGEASPKTAFRKLTWDKNPQGWKSTSGAKNAPPPPAFFTAANEIKAPPTPPPPSETPRAGQVQPISPDGQGRKSVVVGPRSGKRGKKPRDAYHLASSSEKILRIRYLERKVARLQRHNDALLARSTRISKKHKALLGLKYSEIMKCVKEGKVDMIYMKRFREARKQLSQQDERIATIESADERRIEQHQIHLNAVRGMNDNLRKKNSNLQRDLAKANSELHRVRTLVALFYPKADISVHPSISQSHVEYV